MTDYIQSPDSIAFRAALPASEFDQVPMESLESGEPTRVHWRQPAGTTDPFIAGALWGLSWSLTTVFGNTIGDLLNTLTLSNVEQWNGSAWVPLA